MNLWVGVTDNDWYRHLRDRAELDEANFWQPSGGPPLRALRAGQPFLFKLHYPENYIAGGGFFTHWTRLPVSLAWEAFGERNGVGSLSELRAAIEKHRKIAPDPRDDYEIGCIILQHLFYLPELEWIPAPRDWAKNIVRAKTYDATEGIGRELWERVQAWLLQRDLERVGEMAEESEGEPAPLYGDPSLVRRRLGQGACRALVTDTYERRCAVTGEKALPVLQAAHIKPVSLSGDHRVDNGLLLRSDVHTLFDRGYLTVHPDKHDLEVSRRLKDDFDNGEHYYRLQGSRIWLPPQESDRPSREVLEWHADSVFLG